MNEYFEQLKIKVPGISMTEENGSISVYYNSKLLIRVSGEHSEITLHAYFGGFLTGINLTMCNN